MADESVEEQESLLSCTGGDDSTTKSRQSGMSSSPFVPSKLSRLSAIAGSSVLTGSADDDIQRVGEFLTRGAQVGFLMWLGLLGVVHWVAPQDSYQRLIGPERHANLMVLCLLTVTNGSRLAPLFFRDETKFIRTGAMVGSCTIQAIAMASVAIMLLWPTPVLMDQVTGRRVHLVRWAEWTPLSFLMTFLTEGIDMPNTSHANTRTAWNHAICIAFSTSAGLVFPFLKSTRQWLWVLFFSCLLFCSLYIRLYQRSKRFHALPTSITTVDEQEHYDRVRLSLRLLQACSIMWTLLVIGFLGCCITPLLDLKEDSIWASPSLPLVVESVFEVGSKVWYLMLIVDVHELVFDEGSRAVRRLQEMRDIMGVVWDSSSDVICLCVKHDSQSNIHALVSPTFIKLCGESSLDKSMALVFDVRNDEITKKKIPKHKVVGLNMSFPVTQEHVKKNATYLKEGASPTVRRNIASMAALIVKAWNFDSTLEESLIMHEFSSPQKADQESRIQCEAKITRMAEHRNAVVVVLRDISERFQRFQAEKQLVVEVTERKKDAEANRFTRHEVKNSILAAIGLVDSLKEIMAANEGGETARRTSTGMLQNQNMTRSTSDLSLSSSISEGPRTANASNCIVELDFTLREILDTVLSEAMARDVVHEVYEPRMERIDVPSILYGVRPSSLLGAVRFPLISVPKPFPLLKSDAQLLKFIHRNAVSNACKYGEQGGEVKTELYYHDEKKEFQMNVINSPGERHDELVKLDDESVNKVFKAGTRLHGSSSRSSLRSMMGEAAVVSTSTGDGAWIMQKCAKTLGGKCTIEFQEAQTVFTLKCPAQAFTAKKRGGKKLRSSTRFQLPENTWGIAIDDSGIQRKLMDRFLSLVGVKKEKRRIMGKDSAEVLGFNKFLKETIQDNPDDKFLVIVDENLDILDGGAHQKTVSGSLCIKLLREEMDPADESRLLALVRSANDSSKDVALYKDRAHGYLPKAPIQKDRVLELIQPWWTERFPSDSLACANLIDEHESDGEDDFHISSEDIVKTLDVIDALLFDADEAKLTARWPAIREKIHILKGDLKVMKSNARVTTILEALENLKGDTLPDELLERWRLIRSLVVSVL